MCKSSSARPWDGLKPIWWNRTIHFEIMSDPNFAQTRPPPYHAVIFTSTQTDGDNGYSSMADRMVELAAGQPGFLGVESARGAGGLGITGSYW
jgi:hypothetical protein